MRFNGSHLHSLKAGYGPIRCPSLLCLRVALSAICKAIHIQYHLQILLKGCSGQMSAVNAAADEPGVFHLLLLPPFALSDIASKESVCVCILKARSAWTRRKLFLCLVLTIHTGAECEPAA